MSDTSFTLLEIHLHDGFNLTANAEAKNTAPAIGGLFGSSSTEGDDERDSDAEGTSEHDASDDGSNRGLLAALGVLGLVAVAAAAAVALSRREGDEATELTHFADGE